MKKGREEDLWPTSEMKWDEGWRDAGRGEEWQGPAGKEGTRGEGGQQPLQSPDGVCVCVCLRVRAVFKRGIKERPRCTEFMNSNCLLNKRKLGKKNVCLWFCLQRHRWSVSSYWLSLCVSHSLSHTHTFHQHHPYSSDSCLAEKKVKFIFLWCWSTIHGTVPCTPGLEEFACARSYIKKQCVSH